VGISTPETARVTHIQFEIWMFYHRRHWKPQPQSALVLRSFSVCGLYPMWPTIKSSLLKFPLGDAKGGGPVSSIGKIDMRRQSSKRSSELDPAWILAGFRATSASCFHACLFALAHKALGKSGVYSYHTFILISLLNFVRKTGMCPLSSVCSCTHHDGSL
jgi:hypothetical protein